LSFKKQCIERLNEQHWTIVKAFSKRMSNKENGYNHLKPVFDFWMLIMKEINNFFAKQSISTEKENIIKSKFSDKLMDYIKEEFIEFYHDDWDESYNYYGRGSHNQRKLIIEKIFNSFIVSQNDDDKFIKFTNKIKDDLIKLGANEKSATTRISINKIKINKIYGSRNIEWELDEYTNILIGKNGSGKSTVLKLLDAKLHNKTNILENFGKPSIEISIIKEYENGSQSDVIPLGKNAHQQNIDIELVNTFDIIPDTIQDCKESCERKLSLLDIELAEQVNLFTEYTNKLTKVFDKKNNKTLNKINEIMEEIEKGDISKASQIKSLREQENNIELEVYSQRNKFKDVLDSMFKDTNKNINFELIEKSFSITSKREDANIELDSLDLSSGEKQILIIFLTILLKENKPYILMMDEPENSLHSQWQIKFIENIRKLNNNVQLIIATHNPLLMLDREADEIGKISIEDEIINTNGTGTKYLDICATLLNYPQISSLVGKDLEEKIERVFELKTNDNLVEEEKNELKNLENELDGTVASGFIYNHNYLKFLEFIKKENIDTTTIKKMEPKKFKSLLDKYKAKF
jgi:predicted ATPase